MNLKFLATALAALVLTGCRADFTLLLFNNTNDPIVVRLRAQDPHPLVIVPGITGEITGVSTDDFSITQNGRVLHYTFPAAYTFPSAAVPAGYERHVAHVGRVFYFQLGEDDRIYLLRPHEALQDRKQRLQPPGFPLLPH